MPRIRLILSPHDAAGSAAQIAVHRHLEALLAQERGAIAGEVEAIHQMRVATRRMRAALRLFRPYLAGPKPQAVRGELAWLATAAGLLREIDVTEELARGQAGKLRFGPGNSLGPLWRNLGARRRREHRKLVAALGSERYRKLVEELRRPFPTNEQGDAPLGSVAAGLVRPILRKTAAAGARAASNPAPMALHRLRVSVKRSRYAIETLRPLAPPRLARPLKRLEAIQELLGRYHDAAVGAGLLEKWANEIKLGTRATLAAGALIESLRRRERKLGLRSVARWSRLDARAMEREVLDALKIGRPARKRAEVTVSR